MYSIITPGETYLLSSFPSSSLPLISSSSLPFLPLHPPPNGLLDLGLIFPSDGEPLRTEEFIRRHPICSCGVEGKVQTLPPRPARSLSYMLALLLRHRSRAPRDSVQGGGMREATENTGILQELIHTRCHRGVVWGREEEDRGRKV